jgi:hypothetical protein
MFTDEQLATAKAQLEAGTQIATILESLAVEGAQRRHLMQELRTKYGQEAIRTIMTANRPVPTFERLSTMISAMESRLTVEKIDVMLANLAAAAAELNRIKSEIQ